MSRTRKIRVRLPDHPAPVEISATFVNPGGWFKERWLVGVGAGFSTLFYVIEAGDEQSAIDELTDSDWGHIIKDECEHDPKDDGAWCSFAGNYGDHVDLDDVRVLTRL